MGTYPNGAVDGRCTLLAGRRQSVRPRRWGARHTEPESHSGGQRFDSVLKTAKAPEGGPNGAFAVVYVRAATLPRGTDGEGAVQGGSNAFALVLVRQRPYAAPRRGLSVQDGKGPAGAS